MFKKIRSFFKSLFVRSERIELAASIARAIKTFSDTKADDIIIYILNVVVPGSSTITSLVKGFCTDDLPTLLEALELLDASDSTEVQEKNISAITEKIKAFGSIVDEEALTNAIKKALISDNKITISEAKEILTNKSLFTNN